MNPSSAQTLPTVLDPEQTARIVTAVDGLTPEQLHWLSGYAAGLAARDTGSAVPLDSAAPIDKGHASSEAPSLTVLYGSQTGNGKRVAEELAAGARHKGYEVKLRSLADYRPAQLRKESLVSLVVSTHGEGDPPDDAEPFHEYLMSDKAPSLAQLKFSVLALGDSSYVNFCETGRELDRRLAELGAERVVSMVECDVDFATPAAGWSQSVLDGLPELLGKASAQPQLHAVPSVASAEVYDKHRPFEAEVLTNQPITTSAAGRDVRHIELSIEGSGIRYEPGDSLAVLVSNPPALVAEFLEVLDLDGDQAVEIDGGAATLVEALSDKLEITALNQGFLKTWAELGGDPALGQLLEQDSRQALRDTIETHQIIDVVRKHPAKIDAQALVVALRPLTARSYSIASSLEANPDEVHLTVAAVRYRAFGREHWGAASTHLADRVTAGDRVRVYVEKNPRFRLPEDDTAPIVMIGPGTGVAPFRAFVEERAERGAGGDSWLFFGNRELRNDFLYQLEWRRHLRDGSLGRLDVAFSRDQDQKIYVQHRIAEHGADLYEWLERGARVYVCGDAKRMAGDVHEALREVLATHGGLDSAAAEARLKAMRRSGHYQRDVY